MTDRIKQRVGCPYRHEGNGNCLKGGGFCFAVDDKYCPLMKEREFMKNAQMEGPKDEKGSLPD